MKKIIYLIAILVFSFSFTSCGNSDGYKWKGQVTPGEYYGNYKYSMSGKTANVKIQLFLENDGKYELPYSFYAYQPGTYTFRLYKYESGAYIPIVNKSGVQISANFKVLTSNGISDEYLSWAWAEVSEKVVQVVTTSEDIDWTVKVQTE